MATSSSWASISSLCLGSKSWSRRVLLEELGVPSFSSVVADIDEEAIRDPDPRKLVMLLGHAKADAILSKDLAPRGASPGRNLLVTGDSVVSHKDMILEKPKSADEARKMLQSYATAPATTVSSIVVSDVDSGKRWAGVAEAEVYFREMPSDVIDDLIENGGAMESAGGLRVEHPIVERYTDCIIGEKSAVMGFSTVLADKLLKDALASAPNK